MIFFTKKCQLPSFKTNIMQFQAPHVEISFFQFLRGSRWEYNRKMCKTQNTLRHFSLWPELKYWKKIFWVTLCLLYFAFCTKIKKKGCVYGFQSRLVQCDVLFKVIWYVCFGLIVHDAFFYPEDWLIFWITGYYLIKVKKKNTT